MVESKTVADVRHISQMSEVGSDAVADPEHFFFFTLAPDRAVSAVVFELRVRTESAAVKIHVVPGIVRTDVVANGASGVGIVDPRAASGVIEGIAVAPRAAVFDRRVPGSSAEADAQTVEESGHVTDDHVFPRLADNDPPWDTLLGRGNMRLVDGLAPAVKSRDGEAFEAHVPGTGFHVPAVNVEAVFRRDTHSEAVLRRVVRSSGTNVKNFVFFVVSPCAARPLQPRPGAAAGVPGQGVPFEDAFGQAGEGRLPNAAAAGREFRRGHIAPEHHAAGHGGFDRQVPDDIFLFGNELQPFRVLSGSEKYGVMGLPCFERPGKGAVSGPDADGPARAGRFCTCSRNCGAAQQNSKYCHYELHLQKKFPLGMGLSRLFFILARNI